MAPAAVKLSDVAERAGVHPATVSRALSERTRHMVNALTAERVLAAASELGYTPNPIARSLKTNRSFTVAVLLPDLTNPLFPPMVRGIEDALAEAGFTALIANTDNHPDRALAALETMRIRQADGCIAATATRDDGLLADAAGELPMVLINRRVLNHAIPAVVGDDRSGVRQAVEHLAALGHERIAHVAGPQWLSTGADRHEAYAEALRAVGLDPDPELIAFGEGFTEEQGALCLNSLLDGGREFTALVAGNDLMALGCYDALVERDLSCPGDISIVGFNDMPFADKFNPPLTTVRIPHYEMGKRAAELLLERIQGDGAAPRDDIVLPVQLVQRASTAPAPARRARRTGA
ncbi:MAG TPA: LacI family DNA-binding transcriptional regulator [Thermoleophilaceae bacterium]|jgi:LacI family transcriptional regulator